MITIGKDDRVTTAERYAKATVSADMGVPLDRRCDADKLIAAGWATQGDPRRTVALDLYRMGLTGNTQGLSTIIATMSDWLAAWSSRKGRKPMPKVQRIHLVTQTLHWWLNPVCGYCEGRMFELIPSDNEDGARALSTQACCACHGTGKRPLSREVPQAHGAAAQYLGGELNRLVLVVTSEMGKRLANSMTLEL